MDHVWVVEFLWHSTNAKWEPTTWGYYHAKRDAIAAMKEMQEQTELATYRVSKYVRA